MLRKISERAQPAGSGEARQGQEHIKQSDAEAGGKMQSLDPLSGGGDIDPSSKMDERSTRYGAGIAGYHFKRWMLWELCKS